MQVRKFIESLRRLRDLPSPPRKRISLASCQQSDGSPRASPTQIEARPSRFPWLPGLAGETKINSSNPPLTAICTAYATPPLLPFFHPPIKLASLRPRGGVHLNRRTDFPAICFGTLLHAIARIDWHTSEGAVSLFPSAAGPRSVVLG
jgi:hypothetical protein